MKVAPNVIKAAAKDIKYIETDRINQIISHGVKEVERVLPKILHGTIVEAYQTPFRLLSNFGKQQQNKMKKDIALNILLLLYILFTRIEQ